MTATLIRSWGSVDISKSMLWESLCHDAQFHAVRVMLAVRWLRLWGAPMTDTCCEWQQHTSLVCGYRWWEEDGRSRCRLWKPKPSLFSWLEPPLKENRGYGRQLRDAIVWIGKDEIFRALNLFLSYTQIKFYIDWSNNLYMFIFGSWTKFSRERRILYFCVPLIPGCPNCAFLYSLLSNRSLHSQWQLCRVLRKRDFWSGTFKVLRT